MLPSGPGRRAAPDRVVRSRVPVLPAIKRFQNVIAAGVEPGPVVDGIKELDVTVGFRPTDEGGRATLRMSAANDCVRGGVAH
ncbi:hypothetical protein GCM10010464_80000 [Pseudonocardia yunnanensis]